MGGCYSESSSSSRSSSYSSAESSLSNFFRTKERKFLFDAYRLRNPTGFIRSVFNAAGIKEAKDEFPEFEIEAKLNIMLMKAKEGKVPSLEEVTDFFDFPGPGRFLRDGSIVASSGVNHFFQSGGEIVLIEKGGKTYLKYKEIAQPYNLGLRGEEFVLKRRETRTEKSLVEIAEEFLHRSPRNTRYTGSIKKDKAESFVINTESGRVYSLVVSVAEDISSKRFQNQLEVEYAGIVPQVGAQQNDEPAIVSDILHVIKYLILEYGGRNINDSHRLELSPTTETKHDFVGRKTKALPEGNKGTRNGKSPLLEF